jgi:hypothetical protein
MFLIKNGKNNKIRISLKELKSLVALGLKESTDSGERKCVNCSINLKPGTKFCKDCGTKNVCSNCNDELLYPMKKFCRNCGEPLKLETADSNVSSKKDAANSASNNDLEKINAILDNSKKIQQLNQEVMSSKNVLSKLSKERHDIINRLQTAIEKGQDDEVQKLKFELRSKNEEMLAAAKSDSENFERWASSIEKAGLKLSPEMRKLHQDQVDSYKKDQDDDEERMEKFEKFMKSSLNSLAAASDKKSKADGMNQESYKSWAKEKMSGARGGKEFAPYIGAVIAFYVNQNQAKKVDALSSEFQNIRKEMASSNEFVKRGFLMSKDEINDLLQKHGLSDWKI